MKLFKEGRFAFLQPLAYIGKDCIDTFKPFKSSYYIKRDLLQPIHGSINIYKGFTNIGTGIVDLKSSSIAIGIAEILRGLTQIAITPLTWFLRFPCRGIITLLTGFQKAEDGAGIQTEVIRGIQILGILENYNLAISSLQKSSQSRQKLIEIYEEINLEKLPPHAISMKQDIDKMLDTIEKQAENEVAKLAKVRNKTLAVANSVSDTIIRKYEKAKQRGQATDLSDPREPLTVTLNEENKFRTKSFINGLKLFDSDKSEMGKFYWEFSDRNRKISPDRCAL